MGDVHATDNRWVKCISTEGNLRGIAIQATGLVKDLAALHGLKGAAAQGMGEAILGALLLSSHCKVGERINLNIQGSGDFVQALVDAYPDGRVRGYVVERSVGSQAGENGKDGIVIGPWGEGLLSVLRTKDQAGQQPYIGTVPLLTGHLAKDLTFYWLQSEQIPSSVGIFVHCDEQKNIRRADAFLVQVLPGASPAEIKQIERHINEMTDAQKLGAEITPMQFLSQIFQSTAFMIVEERVVQSTCTCSWERVTRALTLVGVKELKAMLIEDQAASVRCDFCTKEYKVDAEGLQKLIDSAASPAGS